jgi:hypothetical protein
MTKDKEEDPDAGLVTVIDYEGQNAGYQARLADAESFRSGLILLHIYSNLSKEGGLGGKVNEAQSLYSKPRQCPLPTPDLEITSFGMTWL